MNETRRFNDLRAQYRTLWDAYQVIAHENSELLRAGKEPTTEQLVREQRAVEAVQLVRNKLLAAISRLGH